MSSEDNANYLIQVALQAGITNRAELAHFMGQMEVECGGFVSMNERLGYQPERLLDVFSGRNGMNTLAEAQTIVAGGRENIANSIYGGAWGARNLGNIEDGDGWKFHGRGYVQLTGRSNYGTAGADLGLDLINHPELAADRSNAANIAVHYWQSRVVPNGHQLDVRAATHDINGGEKHLPERRAATLRWADRFERGYLEDNGLVERLHVPDASVRNPQREQGDPSWDTMRRRMIEGDRPPDNSIPLGPPPAPDIDTRAPGQGRGAGVGATDPLYRNVQDAVQRTEAAMGKVWDDSSERLTASLYGLAREKSFGPGDDLKVAFNEPTATRRGGEIVFLQREGGNVSPGPFANRTQMTTQDALANSADSTLRMVVAQDAQRMSAQLVSQQAEQAEQQRQTEQRNRLG